MLRASTPVRGADQDAAKRCTVAQLDEAFADNSVNDKGTVFVTSATAHGMRVLEAAIDTNLARVTRLPPINFVLDGEPWSFDTCSPRELFTPGTAQNAGLTLRCSARLLWRMFCDDHFALTPEDQVDAQGSPALLRELAKLFRAPKQLWSVQFPEKV